MISTPQGFNVTSVEPIDARLILTKQQMLDISDNRSAIPPVYFAVCKSNDEDRGAIFVYDPNSLKYDYDVSTGYYHKVTITRYDELDSEGFPSINGVTILGAKDSDDYGLQRTLVPGDGIKINRGAEEDIISALLADDSISVNSEGALFVSEDWLMPFIDTAIDELSAEFEAALDSEAQLRKEADDELELEISELKHKDSEIDEDIQELRDKLDSEAIIRAAKDLELEADIDSERSRAMAAEADLDDKKQNKLVAIKPIVVEDDSDRTSTIYLDFDGRVGALSDTLILNDNSELSVKNAVPDFDSENLNKALVVKQSGGVPVLTWGEAGLVDSLSINGHELDPTAKVVNINVGRGLDFEKHGGADFILGHSSDVNIPDPARREILYPIHIDEFGHITDSRLVTFGPELSTSEDGANTKLSIRIKNDGLVDSQGNPIASLKVDPDGLSVQLQSNDYLNFDGNEITFTDAFWDLVQIIPNLATNLNSENVNNIKYPSTKLLSDQLDLKQDLLTFRHAINNSEEVVDVLYDDITVTRNNDNSLQANDIIIRKLNDKQLTNLLYMDTSEGNKLVTYNMLTEAVATALGQFIGNYHSATELPDVKDGRYVQNNDYAFVSEQTSEGGIIKFVYNRYKYVQTPEQAATHIPGTWEFEYQIGDTPFTNAQWNAVTSFWTENGTNAVTEHLANNNIHVTTGDKSYWNNKQDRISGNNGITVASNVVSHTNSIASAQKGSQKRALEIRYDNQGHLTNVTELNMYPPTTVGNDKQAWLSRGGTDQEGNWKDTPMPPSP